MGEPARKLPVPETGFEQFLDDEPSTVTILQRWVERPDGSMELLELPLTPELFLNPELEDTMVQGRTHGLVRAYFTEMLQRWLQPQTDVMVLEDVKHFLAPGLGPAPDVSVIRGARLPDLVEESFSAAQQGVVPCLVIEVVSPKDARIRRTDEVDKVKLYERVGISEYLLVDLPRKATGHRFRLKGYRLNADRRYRPIEPDAQERLLSVTTGLRFGVSPRGDWLEMYGAATGERLLSPREVVELAAREAAARKAAEDEVARLRAQLEQLGKLSQSGR
jgi:Uma2 family endonuclease